MKNTIWAGPFIALALLTAVAGRTSSTRTPESTGRAEESEYSRSEIVSDSGWATMPGMTSPDRGLASACAEKLRGPKA